MAKLILGRPYEGIYFTLDCFQSSKNEEAMAILEMETLSFQKKLLLI